jgi:glycosyltransferase involved in cell wall biosynthesis
MIQLMRLAWFSPLPPVRSGVAAVSASVLAQLGRELSIDAFVDARLQTAAEAARRAAGLIDVFDAHDFLWKHRRDPYNLVVYHLGNAPWHDYIWAYLARYPGLVVIHDPRLHHARARQLLESGRFDDYRGEFWYDHPGAVRDFVEYAVEGLGGSIYYAWSMLRVVMRTARAVAVHNARVAIDLREEFPEAHVDTIRLGTPAPAADPAARAAVRSAFGISDEAFVFTAFGKITADKRIGPIVRAFGALARDGRDVHLLLAGDPSEYPGLARDLSSSAAATRVHVVGYVADESVGDYLTAADACLCLRWPTALESSASWLQCLAAGRPTAISDLAHLADVPTLDPRSRRASRIGIEPVAIAIDLVEEEGALLAAMRALANDPALGKALGRAGRAYWSTNHTVDAMADDYRRAITVAASLPAPNPSDLPLHFLDDHSGRARSIARAFGIGLGILDDGRVPPPS